MIPALETRPVPSQKSDGQRSEKKTDRRRYTGETPFGPNRIAYGTDEGAVLSVWQLREKQSKAAANVKRYARLEERHLKRAAALQAQGKDPSKAAELAERSTSLRKKHAKTALALGLRLARAKGVARHAADAILKTAERRYAGVARPHGGAKTARAAKARMKREKAAWIDEEKRRKDLAAADVEWDPRTAQARRPFAVVNMGGRKRASVSHMEAVLPKRDDRTDARRLTWALVHELQDRVHQGDFAPPRFEPGVDTSGTPGVADDKLTANGDDARLRSHLDAQHPGAPLHRLLVQIVFEERHYTELLIPDVSKPVLVDQLKLALDEAAHFFGVGERKARRA